MSELSEEGCGNGCLVAKNESNFRSLHPIPSSLPTIESKFNSDAYRDDFREIPCHATQ